MASKKLLMSEEVIINMLKALPKKSLINIYWKTIVENDISPLKENEKKDIKQAIKEFKKGETLKWENIR